jgi:non-ribosomal peptide synthetase component F
MSTAEVVEEYAFPLSFQQTRLWLVERLDPANPAYHVPIVLRISGDLRIEALHGALQHVVDRHEALRTRFEPREQVQVVAERWCLVPTVVDLAGLPAATRELALAEVKTEVVREPFDLWSRPPLRVVLVRIADDEHVLVVVLHHIVCDGWSVGLLAAELSVAYSALCAGIAPDLPELDVQYADFALWQREQFGAERLDAELAHWANVLVGAPRALALPTDHPRPPRSTHRGGRVDLVLPEPLTARLEDLARRYGMSTFMVLLSGYAVVLARLSGQDDVVVGTATSGRGRPEVANLVGCFFDVAPLRVDLSGDLVVEEFLSRVREVCRDAYSHQDVPFERLVEHLRPERDPARSPVFQVMLNHHEAPPAMTWPGLHVTGEQARSGVAKYDLTVDAHRHGGGLSLDLEYSRDVFERATAERVLERLARVLAWLADADPASRLSEVDVVTPAEREQLAERWSVAQPSGPVVGAVLDVAANHAARIAVTDTSGASLSFQDVAEASARVARSLAARGVAVGDVVGVLLPVHADVVPVLLGVWRAGAVVLLLDPESPQRRLGFVMTDSAARVVVSDGDLADRVPGSGAAVVLVERLLDRVVGSGPVPEPPVSGQDPAYVRYLAPAGGRPVAVTVAHDDVLGPLGGPLPTLFAPLVGGGRVELRPSTGSLTDHTWAPDSGFAVLDDRQRLVPVGVPGELALRAVGGAHASRPELFAPSPFDDGRALRTGRRAKVTPRGRLEFVTVEPEEPVRVRTAVRAESVQPSNDTEAVVLECFQRALGDPRVGITDGFFDHGGSSLSAAAVLAELEERTGARLELRELFRLSTAAAVAAHLRAGDTADLVCAEIHPAAWQPGHVLLTRPGSRLSGALLEALLAGGGTTVTCLVRTGTGDAMAVWRRVVGRYGDRVRIIAADLAAQEFGMAEAEYRELAGGVAAIYHDTTEDDDRLATAGVVRFAATEVGKALHYLTSLPTGPARGASESLIYDAACAGVPVTVIRTAPVEGAAAAIVRLSRDPAADGHITHVTESSADRQLGGRTNDLVTKGA